MCGRVGESGCQDEGVIILRMLRESADTLYREL